jgi:hypothetical protein
MNEIERLIAAVHRPQPSEWLDETIHALLAWRPQLAQREPAKRSIWKAAAAQLATAACVAAIAFYAGRLSGLDTKSAPGAIAQPVPLSQPKESPSRAGASASSVVSIPLRDDQLASMFVHTSGGEGLLGRGPVKIDVSLSP